MKKIGSLFLMGTLLFSCTKKVDQARNISAFKANEYSVSGDVVKLTDQFKSVNSLGEAQGAINDVSSKLMDREKWESYPEDYRLVASLLLPLTSVRGIAHRSLGIQKDPSRANKKKGGRLVKDFLVQSMIMSQFQKLNSSFSIFFPHSGYKVMGYLTVPYKGIEKDFRKIGDVQDHMMGTVYPQFQRSIQILETIKADTPIVIDSTMFADKGVKIPEAHRYVVIRKHELEALKAMLHNHSHNMILFSHYNRDDVIRYETSIAKKTATGFFPGMTIMERKDVVSKYGNLFDIRKIPHAYPEGSSSWMDTARKHALASVNHEKRFLTHLKTFRAQTKGHKVKAVVHPRISDYMGNKTLKSLEFREKLLTSNDVAVRNPVTGEFTTINFLKFYETPPKDLKAFMPTGFDKKSEKRLKNDGIKYPNYNYGRATGWEVSRYTEYFPSVKSNEDVQSMLRVIGGVNEVQGISSLFGSLATLTPISQHPNPSSF